MDNNKAARGMKDQKRCNKNEGVYTVFQGKNNTTNQQAENHADSVRPQASLRQNFFKAVGKKIQSYKLGDLLLGANLITQNQLDYALATQKREGGQLGQILVNQGSVSAVHLYRKLAEQWCIKASTAGLTLMMGMATITPAKAADSVSGISGDFMMASAASVTRSATQPAIERQQNYPSLFGTKEIKSDNIKPFNKWTDMLARFEDQVNAQASAPRLQMWKASLRSMKSLSTEEKIKAVNEYVNRTRYIEDNQNWSKSDYWATPIEFFSRGGDCEDFAIAKYASLRALGVPHDQMRIAIVQDQIKNIPHAVLIVYSDEGTFVLDNQEKMAKQASAVTRYKPIFSINRTSWWLHKA